MLKKISGTVLLTQLLVMNGLAYAGTQEGLDAYNKKNYSAALTEFQPMADKAISCRLIATS